MFMRVVDIFYVEVIGYSIFFVTFDSLDALHSGKCRGIHNGDAVYLFQHQQVFAIRNDKFALTG
jgi:hypothetical protein